MVDAFRLAIRDSVWVMIGAMLASLLVFMRLRDARLGERTRAHVQSPPEGES